MRGTIRPMIAQALMRVRLGTAGQPVEQSDQGFTTLPRERWLGWVTHAILPILGENPCETPYVTEKVNGQ